MICVVERGIIPLIQEKGQATMNDNKSKALAAALAQIEKQFGKGSIMKMGEGSVVTDLPVVSTGSLGLDIALGIGGLPRGRVVEIYGPESSGKTTLALQVIAEMQKLGGTAAFIDAEHALDPGYAQKLGVNLDELLISQPDTGEQALEIADMLVRSASVDVVVIDSVAALVPKGRDRRRNGRLPAWSASSSDESGAAQADGQHQPHQYPGHFHQPDPDENRRHVRQSGSDHRRQRPQVLRFGTPRHPPHRQHQEGGRSHWQRNPGQGRQEQGRSPFPRSHLRYPLRRRNLARRRDHRTRGAAQTGRQIGILVRLQWREDWPGQGQCPRISQEQAANRGKSRPESVPR
jgi:hypothetical protein